MTPPTDAEAPIFLHYTKQELDRNFDQRGWVANAPEMVAAYDRMSQAARARFSRQTHAYGASDDETLDVFAAADPHAPINVFVHGGAWLNFTKDDFSLVAESFVPAGVTCVVLNFSKVPHVSLPDMVDQVRRGLEWVCRTMASAGGIYVSGWSSGAHLAASALSTASSPSQKDLRAVRGAFFISGPFDLEPVMLSARASYLTLVAEDIRRLSPHHGAEGLDVPVYLAYADGDTDEFQRQSRAFGDALRKTGRLAGLTRFQNVNHFELVRTFGEAGSPLVQTFLQFIETCSGTS